LKLSEQGGGYVNDLNIETVYAAALLHDIGKFYMRTEREEDLNAAYDSYKSIYDMGYSKRPPHEVMGAYFCEHVKVKDAQNYYIQGILGHHRESDPLATLIAIGDKLSASEREDLEFGSGNEEKVKNLVSVLSSVSFRNNEANKERYKKIVKATDPEELLDNSESHEVIVESYRKLWNEFSSVIHSHKELSITQLYYILKEYTANIPSAFYYSKPTISLFSHSSTTAAIAAALYKEFEDLSLNQLKKLEKLHTAIKVSTQESNLNNEVLNEEMFCLLKADVSGIQNFIYNVSMDGAMRALKGRSFYISYLLDMTAWKILKEEGLYEPNLLYSGGGHFYMILPSSFAEKVRGYQEWIDDILYKAHGLQVSVLLEVEKFSPRMLLENRFDEVFRRVSEKIRLKKYQKYDSFVKSGKVFIERTNPVRRCPYCGRELNIKEYEEGHCEFCDSFGELGRNLSKNNYITFEEKAPSKISIDNVYDIFDALGYKIHFSDVPDHNGDGLVFAIDKSKYDLKQVTYYAKTASYYWHVDENSLATLEDMANAADGVKKWGVLRGDVDNLGRIFGGNLSEKRRAGSLSRVGTLSFEVELIFTIYLEKLVKEKYENCSIVYAGGDDFFIVGPWSVLTDLAKDIRDMLDRFSGRNPDVTVSMAIEVAPDEKYPIYTMATNCGESLDRAKTYKRNIEGSEEEKVKNAVSILGSVLGWEEFGKFKSLTDKLENVVRKQLSRKVFQLIYAAQEMAEEAKRTNGIFKSWRFQYYMGRLSSTSNYESEIQEIVQVILETRKDIYKHASLSAKLAELKTRV